MEVYKKYPEEVKSLVLAGTLFSPQTYLPSSHNSLIVIFERSEKSQRNMH
ncbi:MAG: hypothetical protein PHP53_12235 [Prolixibacteraceae bacterium]|nr:hypothetical protein [Prolixibacteraceae bacterium]